MKPFITIMAAIVIIIIAYTQKASILHLIHTGHSVAFFISILFVALLVFFPVMPYPFVAGLIGSIFGVWQGILISVIGVMIGCSIMFLMARYGFQQWVQKMLQKSPKAKEFEGYFEKSAFLGILFLRVVPVIPSPIINILCGVSVIPVMVFLAATLIGKLPNIVISTVVGSLFAQNKLLSIGIYACYFFIITATAGVYISRRKIKA